MLSANAGQQEICSAHDNNHVCGPPSSPYLLLFDTRVPNKHHHNSQPPPPPSGDCSPAISEVLQHIEAGALLPPLVVLQTLAKNKQLKVWVRLVCVCGSGVGGGERGRGMCGGLAYQFGPLW